MAAWLERVPQRVMEVQERQPFVLALLLVVEAVLLVLLLRAMVVDLSALG